MSGAQTLQNLEPIQRSSIADTVFQKLHQQILTLDLPPGTKLSETEVARALAVSRQPVRDAFYRLSKQGFLSIRPQRATVVSTISEGAVMQARFLRQAIEIETVREACRSLTAADNRALQAILAEQERAVKTHDAAAFHTLDDQFHREICERSGHGYAWDLIREHKAHMDRVRYLSLSFAIEKACDEHQLILAAIMARDADQAAEMVRQHLSRIITQIIRIRAENAAYFADDL